jgi:hypothetical protein
MRQWFPSTGGWWIDNRGKAHWEGREQVEDRSLENVSACYRFLRSVPYQTREDLDRLAELEQVALAEAALEQ